MANPSLTGSTPPAHPVFPPPVLTQRTVQLINSAFNTVAALPHAQHSVVDSVPTGDKSHDGDSDDELLAAANAYNEQSATASSAQMAAGGGVGLASWLSGPHEKQSATASAHMPAGGVGPGTQPSGHFRSLALWCRQSQGLEVPKASPISCRRRCLPVGRACRLSPSQRRKLRLIQSGRASGRLFPRPRPGCWISRKSAGTHQSFLLGWTIRPWWFALRLRQRKVLTMWCFRTRACPHYLECSHYYSRGNFWSCLATSGSMPF